MPDAKLTLRPDSLTPEQQHRLAVLATARGMAPPKEPSAPTAKPPARPVARNSTALNAGKHVGKKPLKPAPECTATLESLLAEGVSPMSRCRCSPAGTAPGGSSCCT